MRPPPANRWFGSIVVASLGAVVLIAVLRALGPARALSSAA